MAFTRRFNQVSSPLHVPVQIAVLPPVAWEPCWGSIPNTWPQVQTLLPEPPLSFILGPSQSSFLTAGGTEHIFPVFKSLQWLPIPHKLRFKHLNCLARSCMVGLAMSARQPHLLPLPLLCGLQPLWPSFLFLMHHTSVPSGFMHAAFSAQNSSSA